MAQRLHGDLVERPLLDADGRCIARVQRLGLRLGLQVTMDQRDSQLVWDDWDGIYQNLSGNLI